MATQSSLLNWPMRRLYDPPRLTNLAAAAWFAIFAANVVGHDYQDFDQPPHNYFQTMPRDRFTKLKASLESGQITLDRSSEKAFLKGLLGLLQIPASSQMLVFSTTSLQLSLISPSNPRALYFNEDTYLGYIPGGRIEIVSIDPDLGAVFYIFDIPRGEAPMRPERSTRCMNCHAAEETGHVPGLVVKSVVPGPTGGSLDAHRINLSGHGIPLAERFGGWHVTGAEGFTNHWGNLLGRFSEGNLLTTPLPPGRSFSFATYPADTSDILAHLVHEHQVGFVNRVVEATYRARTYLDSDKGGLTPEHEAELETQARAIVRYLLFVDEVPLPQRGISWDAPFRSDFLKDRRRVGGASLKDWDLKTRMFKHRCSYMIYSQAFKGLPRAVKDRVYRLLGEALKSEGDNLLASDERRTILAILRGTLSDLPKDW